MVLQLERSLTSFEYTVIVSMYQLKIIQIMKRVLNNLKNGLS